MNLLSHKPPTMQRPSHAVIFITNQESCGPNGEVYDYKDRIYNDVNDTGNWAVFWKGQKKHRQDSIVADGVRQVHVCARRKRNQPYIYYGTIKNETIHCMYQGNAANSDPSAYFFELNTQDLHVPFQTSLRGNLSPQAQAIHTLGFAYNGGCCGIYKIWPR